MPSSRFGTDGQSGARGGALTMGHQGRIKVRQYPLNKAASALAF